MSDIVKIKETVNDFIIDMFNWKKENPKTELKQYKDLKDKDTMGKVYRNDQNYYEKLSAFKSKLMGIKGYIIKLKDGNLDRVSSRSADSLIEYIDEQVKILDSEMVVMRSRLKFYENVIFMISNFSYGDF